MLINQHISCCCYLIEPLFQARGHPKPDHAVFSSHIEHVTTAFTIIFTDNLSRLITLSFSTPYGEPKHDATTAHAHTLIHTDIMETAELFREQLRLLSVPEPISKFCALPTYTDYKEEAAEQITGILQYVWSNMTNSNNTSKCNNNNNYIHASQSQQRWQRRQR